MTLGANARIGLFAGLLLAIAGITGGFAGFVVALLLGAAGLLTGRWLDGERDLAGLVERSGLTGRGSDRGR
jgi:uncharacterized membrane protein